MHSVYQKYHANWQIFTAVLIRDKNMKYFYYGYVSKYIIHKYLILLKLKFCSVTLLTYSFATCIFAKLHFSPV